MVIVLKLWNLANKTQRRQYVCVWVVYTEKLSFYPCTSYPKDPLRGNPWSHSKASTGLLERIFSKTCNQSLCCFTKDSTLGHRDITKTTHRPEETLKYKTKNEIAKLLFTTKLEVASLHQHRFPVNKLKN